MYWPLVLPLSGVRQSFAYSTLSEPYGPMCAMVSSLHRLMTGKNYTRLQMRVLCSEGKEPIYKGADVTRQRSLTVLSIQAPELFGRQPRPENLNGGTSLGLELYVTFQ